MASCPAAPRYPRILALLAAAVLGGAMPVVSAADESVLLEAPPPRSVEEEPGALDRAYEEAPAPDAARFPRIRGGLESLPAFFRDTELGVDFRTYYFRRRFNTDRDSEAWAIGGALRYRSGWLFDHLQIGATLFTSQKLYGPSDRDGTLLLRPGQRSYTAIGESFVRVRAKGSELTAYRHRVELPYVNSSDSRMTPNTFEGVTLIGRYERIGYSVGHLLQTKRRNDDDFVSFSEVAGVPGASSKGLTFVGLRLKPLDNLSVGAINHFVKDTLNTAYAETEWFHEDPDGWGLRLATQFTHQRSVGDDRLTGDSFDTWVWGAKVAGSWQEAMLSVAVSITDDEARIRSPWGSYPGYLGMMQRNFNDADEKAWGIGASFYFGAIGVPDLSLALRYGEGYDRRNTATEAKLGDRREFNATVDYRLRTQVLRGLWLRARFGWGQVDDTRRDSLEGRVVLRYEFRVL